MNIAHSLIWILRTISDFNSLTVWSHRLTVRTSGSHPDNRGSIPREITKKNAGASARAFFLAEFMWRIEPRGFDYCHNFKFDSS